MNLEFEKKLPIPAQVKEEYPLSKEQALIIEKRNLEIADIFKGNSDKLLFIIGPCSADNEDSVLDYVFRLAKLQEQVKDLIYIIPRIYTNKPRTTGEGYKGMLHQPDPSKKPDVYKGLVAIRKLHMRVLKETGFSCADEMLYPENYRYLNDVLAYIAVGARSVEDQQHRLTASGIDVPVGMKNPTSGDISVMMNAITAAQHKHSFIYRGWAVHSHGNPLAHAVLRGYVNKHGQVQPNYHYEDLLNLSESYANYNVSNPAVIIDTNHANSGKKFYEQPRIAKEVVHSCKQNESIRKLVKGFMIESYLEEGCQNVTDGVYGKSITDPCLGWADTEKLILEIAELL